MKKSILRILLLILGLLVSVVLTLAGILFFRPTWIINPKNINIALTQVNSVKKWHWDDAQINHEWITWDERHISGYFKKACFVYEGAPANVDSCIEDISWDFNLRFSFKDGANVITKKPFLIRSSKMLVWLKDDKSEEKTPPPDIKGYWDLLWGGLIPDLDLKLTQVKVTPADKKATPTELDVSLTKSMNELHASTMGFKLDANPKTFVITGPEKYKLPYDAKTQVPLYFKNVRLEGSVTEKSIPLLLSGNLEVLEFKVQSKLDLPIEDELTSPAFLKKIILNTTAQLRLDHVQSTLESYGPKPYTSLPAPFNVLDGPITVEVTTSDPDKKNVVNIKALTLIDLIGKKQVFKMSLDTEIPLDLKTHELESINLAFDFKQVSMLLPRVSKRSLPPQFTPDSRFKNKKQIAEKKVEAQTKEKSDLKLHLEALGDKALHIKTNLLKEIIRLNFDLHIDEGELKTGFVQLLPFKTTIFRRPIEIPDLKIIFAYPAEPKIEGTIKFLLPEYKITLHLEGPLSKPEYSFVSVPPLSQDDIYAVLLFGRPLLDLDPDDKSSAKKTNQILSQGILSLSVLYFFAGSPVESIGYDPDSNALSAQFRVGSKNSLRVSRQDDGMNSAGVRRSLGKGWYIDTSVGPTTTGQSDYGVLLERIIAY